MSEIIRFAKPQALSEVDRLIQLLQTSIRSECWLITAQFQPFIQRTDMCGHAVELLYVRLQPLIDELIQHQQANTYFDIHELQLSAFDNFLKCCQEGHGVTQLFWLQGDDCYQFQFANTNNGEYTFVAAWMNGHNLFEDAINQTAEHFNTPRTNLIHNPFNGIIK